MSSARAMMMGGRAGAAGGGRAGRAARGAGAGGFVVGGGLVCQVKRPASGRRWLFVGGAWLGGRRRAHDWATVRRCCYVVIVVID